MSLVRYQPWNAADQFHQELSQLFNSDFISTSEPNNNLAASDWVPNVDIKETKNEFVLHADIPGVDPANIDVHMENGLLSIKGQRESGKTEEHEGYSRIERHYGHFYRRFSLPDTADAEKIHAKCQNGVLEVRIPKQDKLQARKINIEH